ncbi:hypothetical protein Cgig2_017918 [Carnegiea gigantea]|uniref:Ubiquitin-like protease family profile domain-containing protein n=1 Tax=Carnegiea gigantea TaxID=171969 RepID=A0A9Q1QED3_9CARY|nr:hypothetical protein Cgig2_017918 [Carnegiea gigantea]
MSISGISYLIETLSYEQYLAVNEIGFGGFWAIRTNVIPKSLGMWLLENYDYCGSFLNLSNHRILEFTKEDVHATLGLPMGPKKVMKGKTCDSCEKYNTLLGSWRRRWGISSGAPKIGKMRDGILDWGDHEGSSVSIPGVDVAAHYHEPESHDRIQIDHPSHAKGKIVGILILLLLCREVLFEYDVDEEDLKFWLNREGMMSMTGATEHLECILLNAWCVLMNKEELKRNPDAPKRMFFSHNVFKAVDDETTLPAKFKAFIQVFFVILRKEHCFLLCFDMVRGKMTIIDNRILKTTVDEKYKDCYHIMYMYKTLHPRSRKIKEFDIEYLELPWQDEVNVHDCGIFVMRHMESYQGQDSSCWDAGFGKKNKEQYLRLLRSIYCARILTHPINKLRMTVSETAKKFFQQEQQSRKAT